MTQPLLRQLYVPDVVVRRSGGRSGRAALELEAAGFHVIASMRGGMLAWGAAGLEKARHAQRASA